MNRKPAKQTRRSISVRGTTYDTLRECCERESRSMSDVVEELLAGYFARRGEKVGAARPTPERERSQRAQPSRGTAGRPAPTPAAVVLGNRRQKANDYRAFQF